MSVRNTESTVMTGLNSRSAHKVILNMLAIKYSTRDITAENAMNIYLQRQLCVDKAKVHDKRGQALQREAKTEAEEKAKARK